MARHISRWQLSLIRVISRYITIWSANLQTMRVPCTIQELMCSIFQAAWHNKLKDTERISNEKSCIGKKSCTYFLLIHVRVPMLVFGVLQLQYTQISKEYNMSSKYNFPQYVLPPYALVSAGLGLYGISNDHWCPSNGTIGRKYSSLMHLMWYIYWLSQGDNISPPPCLVVS